MTCKTSLPKEKKKKKDKENSYKTQYNFGHLNLSSIFIAAKFGEKKTILKSKSKNSIRFGKFDDQLGNVGSI